MTPTEQQLLNELEQLEKEREAEQKLLQSELSIIKTKLEAISKSQSQILQALQKDEESESLAEQLKTALAPLFGSLEANLSKELEKLSQK